MTDRNYIAVDWGTSNRRAWAVRDGAVVAELEDDRGFIRVPPGGFAEEVAGLRARLGDLPMLLAGMVGARGGWVPVDYLPCPLGLAELAAGLVEVPGARAWIVPGARPLPGARADVIRGEETQFVGAVAAGMCAADALICHPGTHNKWARLEGGRLTEFRTVMTGEMFNLLKEGSLLKAWLGEPAVPGDAFAAGVEQGGRGDALTSDIFGVRAKVLLGELGENDVASYVSGLLIGADLRTGMGEAAAGEEIVVMGRGSLTRLFSAALGQLGHPNREVDGEAAFLAGIAAIMEARA